MATAFNTVVIPDYKNPNSVYIATKNGDKVTVNHKNTTVPAGNLGGAGTLQTMTIKEFETFLKENVPNISGQPASDTFESSKKA